MLPKCVKTDAADAQSRLALIADGWRQIGKLVTYRGDVDREMDSRVQYCTDADAIRIAEEVVWSGRLWRDETISSDDAWRETERFLKDCYRQDSGRTIYRLGSAAFGVFEGDRVLLIGVHPVARGLGLAAILMRHARARTAGTYADNESAISLYKSLGMRAVKEEAVWHK